MTAPFLYRGKKKPVFPPLGATARLMLFTMAWTLAGGVAASLTFFVFHKKALALGVLLGSFLSILNLQSLKFLTEKILGHGEKANRGLFWVWNSVRWAFFAGGFWLFLMISPSCLFGAVMSYFWFLIILGWAGWQSATSPKIS